MKISRNALNVVAICNTTTPRNNILLIDEEGNTITGNGSILAKIFNKDKIKMVEQKFLADSMEKALKAFDDLELTVAENNIYGNSGKKIIEVTDGDFYDYKSILDEIRFHPYDVNFTLMVKTLTELSILMKKINAESFMNLTLKDSGTIFIEGLTKDKCKYIIAIRSKKFLHPVKAVKEKKLFIKPRVSWLKGAEKCPKCASRLKTDGKITFCSYIKCFYHI